MSVMRLASVDAEAVAVRQRRHAIELEQNMQSERRQASLLWRQARADAARQDSIIKLHSHKKHSRKATCSRLQQNSTRRPTPRPVPANSTLRDSSLPRRKLDPRQNAQGDVQLVDSPLRSHVVDSSVSSLRAATYAGASIVQPKTGSKITARTTHSRPQACASRAPCSSLVKMSKPTPQTDKSRYHMGSLHDELDVNRATLTSSNVSCAVTNELIQELTGIELALDKAIETGLEPAETFDSLVAAALVAFPVQCSEKNSLAVNHEDSATNAGDAREHLWPPRPALPATLVRPHLCEQFLQTISSMDAVSKIYRGRFSRTRNLDRLPPVLVVLNSETCAS